MDIDSNDSFNTFITCHDGTATEDEDDDYYNNNFELKFDNYVPGEFDNLFPYKTSKYKKHNQDKEQLSIVFQ